MTEKIKSTRPHGLFQLYKNVLKRKKTRG